MSKIHALTFSNEPDHSPWLHFIARLHPECENLSSGPIITGESDIILFNLDLENFEKLFQMNLFNQKAKKIAFVSELSINNLSALRIADYVFFQSRWQQLFAENYFGLRFPSQVMAYPKTSLETDPVKDCFLFFNNEFSAVYLAGIKRQLKKAIASFEDRDIREFHACFKAKPGNEKMLSDFSEEISRDFGRKINTINGYNRSWCDIVGILSKCQFGEFISYEFQADEFEELLAKRSTSILYTEIKSSPIVSEMIGCGIKFANPYGGISGISSVKDQPIPSFRELLGTILSVASEGPNVAGANGTTPDQLSDLSIVQGAILSNRYIFSVCYRNQADKIERCLNSIVKQNKALDFGIVVIDDASEDGSVEIAKRLLAEYGVPHAVVANRERKHASRNFYNVIHLLVDNPDSVIMEIDGDDFLPNRDVLDEIAGKYKQGFLKTNGAFIFFPEELNFSRRKDKIKFHQNLDYKDPWNISKCNAWLPLRTCTRKILASVEIEYFLNKNDGSWLKMRHDSAIQPRVIELCEGKTCKIDKVTYVYDLSGVAHDHYAGNGIKENGAGGAENMQSIADEHFQMIKNICSTHHPFLIGRIDKLDNFTLY